MVGTSGTNSALTSTCKRARRAGGGPAPGRQVGVPGRQHDDAGRDQRVHPEPPVQRQHRRRGDDVAGGAVAVERDDGGQDRGADDDPDRVAMHEPKHGACHRVEQAGVDHEAEVEDGEQQQHARGREVADAVQHHRPDVAGGDAKGGAEEREGDRHQDQRQQGREPVGHDQRHEDDDHRVGQQGEHASSLLPPCAALWGPVRGGRRDVELRGDVASRRRSRRPGAGCPHRGGAHQRQPRRAARPAGASRG